MEAESDKKIYPPLPESISSNEDVNPKPTGKELKQSELSSITKEVNPKPTGTELKQSEFISINDNEGSYTSKDNEGEETEFSESELGKSKSFHRSQSDTGFLKSDEKPKGGLISPFMNLFRSNPDSNEINYQEQIPIEIDDRRHKRYRSNPTQGRISLTKKPKNMTGEGESYENNMDYDEKDIFGKDCCSDSKNRQLGLFHTFIRLDNQNLNIENSLNNLFMV